MSEINQDENVMENLTTEFAEYICDMVCGNLDDVKNQEDADRICDECKLGSFICNICNEYNRINNFEKSQMTVLLKEISNLRKGYKEVVERLEEEIELAVTQFPLQGKYIKKIRAIEIVNKVGGMNENM